MRYFPPFWSLSGDIEKHVYIKLRTLNGRVLGFDVHHGTGLLPL